jgi:hypothetical protein
MNLVELLLTIQNQLKIFHWQTKSYAEHKALDDAYGTLTDLFDEFLETYMGKYGRPKAENQFTINLENYSENYISCIKTFKLIVQKDLSKAFSEEDTDLLNLRDEILGALNKLCYLLSLK